MTNQTEYRAVRPKILTIVGITMIIFGSMHIIMTIAFIMSPDFVQPYVDRSLTDAQLQSQVLYDLAVIELEIIGLVAAVIGIIFGFGIFARKMWAFVGTIIFNIIFVLGTSYALATNEALIDSYLAIASVVLLAILFMPKTRSYFRKTQLGQTN